MSTLTLINSLPLVTLTTPGSQLIINESSTNNTLSRITVGNFLATFLPEGALISNPTGTLAVGLDLSTLFTISSVGSDGLGTLTLATLSAGQVLGNPTGATAAVEGAGLSLYLDSNFGSVEGDILYRGSAGWLALPAGTAGNVLTTDSTAGPPSWQPVAGGSPWQITDGTHTVTGVVDLIVPSGGVSASGTGTAHLVFPGGSGSLELVQGSTTLAAVSTLTLTGSGGTLSGAGASGTLALTGANVPAAGLVLSTGTTLTDATIGANLALSSGTLSVSRTGFPVNYHGYVPGTQTTASQIFLTVDVATGEAASFGTNLANSIFKLDSAATANTTLTCSQNGTSVATVVYPAASTSGTGTSAGFTTAVNDAIKWTGPATPDASAAGFRIAMHGTAL